MGWWSYTEHHLRLIRASFLSFIANSLGEPVLYLAAMGLGLGQLIDRHGVTVGGVPYLAFVAPSILVQALAMTGMMEVNVEVANGFRGTSRYETAAATPLSGSQIAIGQLGGVCIRLLGQGYVFLLVMLLFGATNSGMSWMSPIVGTAAGLAFAAPIQAYAATIVDDRGQLGFANRFVVTPMAFLAGTYFPLSALPPYLQWVGWISPMWHGSQLARAACFSTDDPVWLLAAHGFILVLFIVAGTLVAGRVYDRRLGGLPKGSWLWPIGRPSARRLSKQAIASRHEHDAQAQTFDRSEFRLEDPEGQECAAQLADHLCGPRIGRSLYSGNIRAVVSRGLLTLRGTKWVVILAGFFEPVLYFLAIGLGVGGYVGDISGPHGQSISYLGFIAPALLASSAMNGSIYETTWGVFRKINHVGTYEVMLNTPLGSLDLVFGEMAVAVVRGFIYSAAFLTVMSGWGVISAARAILMIPAAVLISFAFAALGLAMTSLLHTAQQMRLVAFIFLPLFLFSGTFFPIAMYPAALQVVVEVFPLWHGVELTRALAFEVPSADVAVNALYLLAVGVVGVVAATRRFERLFVR